MAFPSGLQTVLVSDTGLQFSAFSYCLPCKQTRHLLALIFLVRIVLPASAGTTPQVAFQVFLHSLPSGPGALHTSTSFMNLATSLCVCVCACFAYVYVCVVRAYVNERVSIFVCLCICE